MYKKWLDFVITLWLAMFSNTCMVKMENKIDIPLKPKFYQRFQDDILKTHRHTHTNTQKLWRISASCKISYYPEKNLILGIRQKTSYTKDLVFIKSYCLWDFAKWKNNLDADELVIQHNKTFYMRCSNWWHSKKFYIQRRDWTY